MVVYMVVHVYLIDTDTREFSTHMKASFMRSTYIKSDTIVKYVPNLVKTLILVHSFLSENAIATCKC